jgi:hypothetical protein
MTKQNKLEEVVSWTHFELVDVVFVLQCISIQRHGCSRVLNFIGFLNEFRCTNLKLWSCFILFHFSMNSMKPRIKFPVFHSSCTACLFAYVRSIGRIQSVYMRPLAQSESLRPLALWIVRISYSGITKLIDADGQIWLTGTVNLCFFVMFQDMSVSRFTIIQFSKRWLFPTTHYRLSTCVITACRRVPIQHRCQYFWHSEYQ